MPSKTRKSTKPAAPVEPDEVEDLDVEVEDTADEEVDTDVEVEDDAEDGDDLDDLEVEDAEEEPEPAPKKSAKKKAADAPAKPKAEPIQFGSAWLAEHVSKETGKDYNAFGIRTLLRKLVKDGVLDRNVGEDRSRYSFSGPNDATVKAVIKAIKSGDAEKAKAAKIEEAKKAAAKKTAATADKPAAKKGKKAPEPEVADEDDDSDEDIEDL